jgi:hypothetical protein
MQCALASAKPVARVPTQVVRLRQCSRLRRSLVEPRSDVSRQRTGRYRRSDLRHCLDLRSMTGVERLFGPRSNMGLEQ